jgi:hypothetical protein
MRRIEWERQRRGSLAGAEQYGLALVVPALDAELGGIEIGDQHVRQRIAPRSLHHVG